MKRLINPSIPPAAVGTDCHPEYSIGASTVGTTARGFHADALAIRLALSSLELRNALRPLTCQLSPTPPRCRMCLERNLAKPVYLHSWRVSQVHGYFLCNTHDFDFQSLGSSHTSSLSSNMFHFGEKRLASAKHQHTKGMSMSSEREPVLLGNLSIFRLSNSGRKGPQEHMHLTINSSEIL